MNSWSMKFDNPFACGARGIAVVAVVAPMTLLVSMLLGLSLRVLLGFPLLDVRDLRSLLLIGVHELALT